MITDLDYFKIPRISNSILSIASDILAGRTQKQKPLKAFAFGRVFHELCIEGIKPPNDFDPNELDRLYGMKKAYNLSPIYKSIRCTNRINREKVYLFVEPQTNTDCKAKIDLSLKSKIFDLKTTSAKTQEEFQSAMIRYSYDRQLAFYFAATGIKEGYLIGISKVNHKVFTLHYKATDKTISNGQAKYLYLLNRIKQDNLYPQIFQTL